MMSPEIEAKIQERARTHGPFMVMSTLVGGQVDRNRRTIENVLTGEIVTVFNEKMGEWTQEMQQACDNQLQSLNAEYLARQSR